MGKTALPFAIANFGDSANPSELSKALAQEAAQDAADEDNPRPRRSSIGADRRTTSLAYRDLELGVADWLSDSQYRDCTPATLQKRTILTKNLLWFLKDRELPRCGVPELKAFIT